MLLSFLSRILLHDISVSCGLIFFFALVMTVSCEGFAWLAHGEPPGTVVLGTAVHPTGALQKNQDVITTVGFPVAHPARHLWRWTDFFKNRRTVPMK
jgi:hypothetical protein